MIGCWTLSEPMQLILEYVPHGNLLNWLRRKRPKVSRECFVFYLLILYITLSMKRQWLENADPTVACHSVAEKTSS